MSNQSEKTRRRRKAGIRKRVRGTSERPRLSVFRSNKHIYAQVIDDSGARAIASFSTGSKAIQGELKGKNKVDSAKLVGEELGKACLSGDQDPCVRSQRIHLPRACEGPGRRRA